MILPLYATLTRLDQTLNEAAADLGETHLPSSQPSPCLYLCLASLLAVCLSLFLLLVNRDTSALVGLIS